MHVPTILGALALLVLLALGAAGCAASSRDKTLKTSLVLLDTAESAFVTYDRAHELAIVAAAPSKGEMVAELDGYRKQRMPVIEALQGSYRALAVAAILSADAKDLAHLQLSIGAVTAALAALGVTPAGTDTLNAKAQP